MNFLLFLFLNAVLLIRPEELIPELTGIRLYYVTILFCTISSLPRLLRILSPSSLAERPVAVCVLLFFASTIISECFLGRFNEALFEFGPEFAKVILYYFLLLAVVDTPGRFRAFVATLIALIAILTAVALAQHYEMAQFPNIVPCSQREIHPETGEEYQLARLVSSGIFNDPNDLCLVLGLGIWCCIYCSTTSSRGWVGRVIWLLPIPLYLYALTETHSRGGMLGVLGGGAAYLYSRYGGSKAIPLAAAGAAAAMLVLSGRQASLAGGGTAHQRVMAWADGLGALFSQPLSIPTGLGMGWFVGEHDLVAHNSFIQAYVELGCLGGGTFLGAFVVGGWIVDRLGRGVVAPDWAVQARPFTFAALIGYAIGCYSLTRNYVVPTYLTLGLATVVSGMAGPFLPDGYRVGRRWFGWMVVLSIAGLIAIRFFTMALGRAGV